MTINCEERYREALAHAEKTGDTTLQQCLDHLERVDKHNGYETILFKDRSALSFLFSRMKDGVEVLRGGLIYHGNPDESFSFQIEKSIGWQIHT